MTAVTEPTPKLPGEGETKFIVRVRERVPCGNCGEPADQKHSYLLPDARRNPASSGCGKDDISWCSDHDEYTCAACRAHEWNGREPKVEGYRSCSTYSLSERFAHMFLRWREHAIPDPANSHAAMLAALKDAAIGLCDAAAVASAHGDRDWAATFTIKEQRVRAAIALAEEG